MSGRHLVRGLKEAPAKGVVNQWDEDGGNWKSVVPSDEPDQGVQQEKTPHEDEEPRKRIEEHGSTLIENAVQEDIDELLQGVFLRIDDF